VQIRLLLKLLEDLEGGLASLYQRVGDSFALDPEAQRVFHALAREEKGHVALVAYLQKVARRNPDQFADVNVDVTEIQRLTTEAARLLNSGKRLGVPEAVAVALSFEKSAAEAHLRSTVSQSNQDIVKLMTALSAGDKNHLTALVAFAKRRGVPTEPDAR